MELLQLELSDIEEFTGFEDLEVIDIDLKVLPMELRAAFFTEFIAFVRDNVDGFDKKVAVHKTMNFGYHLTYRTRLMMGNEKIAVPVLTGLKSESSGKTQALIESRGTGGYALLYDECTNGLDYTAIQYLSDEEHNTILAISNINKSIDYNISQMLF